MTINEDKNDYCVTMGSVNQLSFKYQLKYQSLQNKILI